MHVQLHNFNPVRLLHPGSERAALPAHPAGRDEEGEGDPGGGDQGRDL